jgi:uncharacterized protein YukJ
MPIQNYGVLKGHAERGELVFDRDGKNPHFRIYLQGRLNPAQIDVNVESSDGSEVLYEINRTFAPPSPDALNELPSAFTPVDRVAGGLALDYVRQRIGGNFMVQRSDMTPLPIPKKGSTSSDLQNAVIQLLSQMAKDAESTLYAFGSGYADSNGASGIHNIHMNQGNAAGNFEGDNGTWQDGALFINLPSNNQWIALFIGFQTESWNTDAQGNPV